MYSHILCALFGFIEFLLIESESCVGYQNFFTSVIVNSFYIGMVLYCIFANRFKSLDDPKCDTLRSGWIRYETRVFLSWLVSNAIFLLYANLFKFQSKWKKI